MINKKRIFYYVIVAILVIGASVYIVHRYHEKKEKEISDQIYREFNENYDRLIERIVKDTEETNDGSELIKIVGTHLDDQEVEHMEQLMESYAASMVSISRYLHMVNHMLEFEKLSYADQMWEELSEQEKRNIMDIIIGYRYK